MTGDWWRNAVIYQIYPRSYMDSNNDGIGDINGIISRLYHIANLGVDAIWLSPFFASPMKDFGYDVSDYRHVDPIFGTNADFDNLLTEAHKQNIKVIIDMVLNHTSDEHSWFIESRQDRTNHRSDWYVWADPKADGTPPNNWISVFGGPAWCWEPLREQYYLHNFLESQPDLNFHCREVREQMLNEMRFWLEKGVDGVRLDTVNFYFHDKKMRNNPATTGREKTEDMLKANPYAFQDHLYDKTQPENISFLNKIRLVLDEYKAVSIGEIGDDNAHEVMAEYTGPDRLHMAYTFDLLKSYGDAGYIRQVVDTVEKTIKDGWPLWSLGNHDVRRVVSRWDGTEDADAFAKLCITLLLLLKGSLCIYQGEELGLEEADIPFDMICDPPGRQFWPRYKGRDGCRTPMPWDSDKKHSGFSGVAPWLPVFSSHYLRAVNVQEENSASVLHYYRRILHWYRGQPVLDCGKIRFMDVSPPLLGIIRYSENEDNVVSFLNLGSISKIVDISKMQGVRPIEKLLQNVEVQPHQVKLNPYGVFLGILPKNAIDT